MAKEGHNESSGRKDLPTTTAAKEGATRRSILKTVGIVAGAGIVTGAAEAQASGSDYETITVGANSTESISVGSNETLENVLIDVTASGARVRISASGSDWTIRNVGVKGQCEYGGDTTMIIPQVDSGSTGTIEHFYMGDGSNGDNHYTGMWVYAGEHAGTLKLNEVNAGGWTDNAIYGSGPGVYDEYGMGEVHIENSYAHDNNISGFRIGTPGSYVRDSVVDNTDGSAPPLPGGAVNARGIWAKEQSGLEVDNCDIANPGGIAIQASDDGEVTLTNTRTDGQVYERGNGIIDGSGGGDPNLTPPAGVPMSAEEAAAGISSSGSSGSDSGSDGSSSSGDSPELPNTMSVETNQGGPLVEYEATVGGTATKGPAAENNDTITEDGDNTTITGVTGNGYTDDFNFDGELTEFSASVDAQHYTVYVNGNKVDPDGLGQSESDSDTETQPRTLVVDTDEGGPIVECELTIDGTASLGDDAEANNDDVTDNGDGTTTITAITGNGYSDNFTINGTLTDVTANVDAQHYRVLIDGQEVALDELPESGSGSDSDDEPQPDRILIVDTDEGGPLVECELTIDGTASLGDNAEANNDDVTDNGDGTTTITAITGNGYSDNFTINGTLTDVTANVDAQHYRVLIDDQEVDLSSL